MRPKNYLMFGLVLIFLSSNSICSSNMIPYSDSLSVNNDSNWTRAYKADELIITAFENDIRTSLSIRRIDPLKMEAKLQLEL